MKFKSLSVKNFRNFENIDNIELSNKNIFFGLNDIGKTNLLYAIRYVFDKNTRKQGFIDTDFHNKNTSEPIEILISVDISDINDKDNKKLRAKLRGCILTNENIVYIKLLARYNQSEQNTEIEMFWGGNLEKLCEIKSSGYQFDLDKVFNVTYIDAYVDLYLLFKKNASKLIVNNAPEDAEKLKEINMHFNNINNIISTLSGIENFENDLNPSYKQFHDEDIAITIKSEMACKGLLDSIIPYIKQTNNDNLFPTAGEGRKKLLTYSIFDLIAKLNDEKKINLFLIEEPENHLHKSMQIALSQTLFNNEKYKYMFVTTHSPYVLYEMNNVNLVRIFGNNNIIGKSTFYKVPKNYEKLRNMLNKNLSEAIFANKVLLVEGQSEYLLFNKVLSVVKPYYESYGIYILSVQGIGFNNYFNILQALNIKFCIKTDNDIRYNKQTDTYDALGFSRINTYIRTPELSLESISSNTNEYKKELYKKNKSSLDIIRKNNNIYLSKVDLENDLDECMHDRLVALLEKEDPVEFLQSAKQYNMVTLVEKLTDDDCMNIYNHYNFACLKDILQ